MSAPGTTVTISDPTRNGASRLSSIKPIPPPLRGELGRTLDRLVLAEASVGLRRVRSLLLHAGTVLQRQLVDGIPDSAALSPCPYAENEARAVACADEDVLSPRWAMDEVP